MDTLADELHRQARRNFPRRKVIVKGLNEFWQGDLVEMQPYAKQNRGFRYLLTVIDVWSKFAWAIPVKTKTGKDVTEAFEKILKDTPTPPKLLQLDHGKEFYNKPFQACIFREEIKCR